LNDLRLVHRSWLFSDRAQTHGLY